MKRGTFKKPTLEEVKKKQAEKRERDKLKVKVKKPTNKRIIYGVKVWSLKVADTKFSLWLRQKVGKCELCGTTEGLTVSHYIGRKEKSTRFLVDNCDVFCWSCHSKWEDRKQYEYREWKIKKIGKERHDKLKELQRGSLGEKDSIYNCMKLLELYKQKYEE